MRPEKAARISSYLARNSARISIMNREREDLLDYYEKQKYSEYAVSEGASNGGENIAKRRARLEAQHHNAKSRKTLFSGRRKGMWSGLSFGLIIVMIILVMHLMG